MIKVLPSSNPEKEDNLIAYVKQLEGLDVEYLHCDVMDGKFVEATCLSLEKLREVRNNTNILLDVHLMVDNPIKVIKDYISLKPNILTIHYEAVRRLSQIKKISKMLRDRDILFGLSIKPNTPVSDIVKYSDDVDLILIMSVEPGKSGQKYIEESTQKIKDAHCLCQGRNIIIEVDGGINLDNYKNVIDAGAEFLVMGNAFYKSENKSKLLNTIDKHYKLKK